MKSVFAALVAIVVAFATVAAAQTNTGEVAGVVMDASGGVLPGATVTATHPASGTVVTRDAGATVTSHAPGAQRGKEESALAIGDTTSSRTGKSSRSRSTAGTSSPSRS